MILAWWQLKNDAMTITLIDTDLAFDDDRLTLALAGPVNIDAVLVGGNHLANAMYVLKAPPGWQDIKSFDEALEMLGGGVAYDVWVAWRAIMDLKEARQ